MTDRELRRQLTSAFSAARTRLPSAGPLGALRRNLDEIRRDYQQSLPRVVLVGRSGAGKTSLANALVGTNLFATGPSAPTRVVTRLRDAAGPDLTGASQLLSRLDLIDTPDLQDPATTALLREGGADALVPLFIRGNPAASDEAVLRDFQEIGRAAEIGVPLNCVGVLPLDSLMASDIESAKADAATVIAGIMRDDAASRLLYDLRPVAIRAAAAAHTMGADDVADLSALVAAATRSGRAGLEALLDLTHDGGDFTDPDDDTLPGDPAIQASRRSDLWRLLGGYGLQLVFTLLAEGADAGALRRGLRDGSGVTEFAGLLTEHFAQRADLIKAHAVIGRAEALVRQVRDAPDAGLTGWDYATLNDVAGLFRGQASVAWDTRTVVSDCRSGRLSLDNRDVADALRILGEPGQSVRERLGLPAVARDDDLANRAIDRKNHWARLDQFPFDGDTRRACRTVLRACEVLVSETGLD